MLTEQDRTRIKKTQERINRNRKKWQKERLEQEIKEREKKINKPK